MALSEKCAQCFSHSDNRSTAIASYAMPAVSSAISANVIASFVGQCSYSETDAGALRNAPVVTLNPHLLKNVCSPMQDGRYGLRRPRCEGFFRESHIAWRQ
jgi:hypothetical protein